jgi:hypothetical protein
MGTAQTIFAVVLCGGATGSHVTGSDLTGSDMTGSDVSHVIGSDVSHCPEVCYTHAQPEIAQYPP